MYIVCDKRRCEETKPKTLLFTALSLFAGVMWKNVKKSACFPLPQKKNSFLIIMQPFGVCFVCYRICVD